MLATRFSCLLFRLHFFNAELFGGVSASHKLHVEQCSNQPLHPHICFVSRWDKHVVIYGEPKLKKEHPVVAFLAADKHAKSINIYTDG